MRKLMLLIAMVAVALLAASPAMAQSAGIENGPKAEVKDGVPSATAGGASAKGGECPEAVAGGVVAKAGCEKKAPPPPAPPKAAPPAPAPAPKAAPAPAPKAQLPKTGGSSVASLFALGGGVLLVGGGLLARRLIK